MKAMSTVNFLKKVKVVSKRRKGGTMFQDLLPYFNYL